MGSVQLFRLASAAVLSGVLAGCGGGGDGGPPPAWSQLEDGNSSGINGDETTGSNTLPGAVYLY